MPNYPAKENSCKNFAPNFFDKNKCQNCFRPRESHLLSDKDLSKAKPVYVGWLLLAPIGTDFDNPVHKSRKWQRRWFVLFEHGALLYALDDNQSTIAQGTINMNSCSDVVRAESITGQKNSLCIYLPEQKYFVRCEGKEEMIGWQEALLVFPNTVKEEAKRKKKLKNRRSVEPSQAKPEPNNNTISVKEELPKQEPEPEQTVDPSYFSIDRKSRKEKNNSDTSSSLRSKKDSISSVDSIITNSSQDSGSKKHLKESETFPVKRYANNQSKKDGDDEVKVRQQPVERDSQPRTNRQRPQSMYISPNNKENDDPYILSPASVEDDVVDTSPKPHDDRHGRAISRRATYNKRGTQTKESTSSLNLRRAKSLDRKTYQLLQIPPDLLNFKKGWLTKQSEDEKWSRYWFVLADNFIKYYRDVIAEETGDVDGEIKLQDCKKVGEKEVQRNYGFQIHTTDKVYTLAAMTSGIRRNWINAITSAAKPPADVTPDITNTTTKLTGDSETEKSKLSDNERKKESKTLDEMSATERSQLRRQRIRERRKEGRSKTFDFAEFKPLVDQMKNKNNEKNEEVQNSDQEERTIRRTRPGSLRRARHRTMDSSDVLGLKKDINTSPFSENEWTKIEPNVPITESNNKPTVILKSLKSEVEQLKKQLERANTERVSVVTDHEEDSSVEISNEPADELQVQVKRQDKELKQLKEELRKSNEQVQSTVKELRECNTQLDITLSEAEVSELQIKKVQNELQIANRKSSELTKENDVRFATLCSQMNQSKQQLKTSEEKVLDLQQKLREYEHQITLQTDQHKEVTRLKESNAILSAETEDQEQKLSHMQEAYEDKCQELKDLEEDLSHSKQMIVAMEIQLTGRSTDDDIRQLQTDISKLHESLKISETQQEASKEAKQKMEAEYEVLEDCNHSLQDQLKTSEKLSSDLTNQLTVVNSTLETKQAEMTELTNRLQELSAKDSSNKQLRQQILELTNKLRNAEQQLHDFDNVRQGERKKSGSSFKEKLSELEADMGDTSHMLDERLTALATPRKDDSDESTASSASSHNDLRRKSKQDEDARLKAKVLYLQQELNELNTKRDSTAKLSRSFEELCKQKVETDSRISTLADCLRELHAKVVSVNQSYFNDKNSLNAVTVLPYVESGLEEALKVLGVSSRASTPSSNHSELRRKNSPVSARAKKESKRKDVDNESPKAALLRLRMLIEKLKSTEMKSSLKSADSKLSKEEKQRLFAHQISLQALIIAEMARTLDRNKNLVLKDNQLPELSDIKSTDKSSLLSQSGVLAQRLLLQSKFTEKLYKLRESYKCQQQHKINSKTYSTKSNKTQQENVADLTITHSHINYLLTVYNQRINELRREKTSAEHKSHLVHKKLKELVEACKSQQVETISRIAVEIDTGVDLTPQIDEVPMWTQQADYGTLHGATSVPIDLEFESAFFESLVRDVSCMKTHVSSIVDLGTKIQDVSNVLTKSLQPSEIGLHASTIAYEAISQAELCFIGCRLREDYESRMNELKLAMMKQNEHIVTLERSRLEKESFDDEKCKQLQIEHQRKVALLMEQLKVVENNRVATTRDMDLRLANLAQKQKDELEACNVKHAEVIKSLQAELSEAKSRLSLSSGDHAKEILSLKVKFTNIQEQQKQEREQMKKNFEDNLKKVDAEKNKTIEELKQKFNHEEINNKENQNVIITLKSKHENEVEDLQRNFVNEMKTLKQQQQNEVNVLSKDHNGKLKDTISHWSKRLQQSQQNADSVIEEERLENAKEINQIKKSTILLLDHKSKLEELKRRCEEQLKDKDDQLKTALEDRDNLLKKDSNSASLLANKVTQLEQQLSAAQTDLKSTKQLCDSSVDEIKAAHQKQLDELATSHKREIEQIQLESSREDEEDQNAMKLALDSLRKHHEEKMASLSQTSPDPEDVKLQEQLEGLSEQYSMKCVELSQAKQQIDELNSRVSNITRDYETLLKRNKDIENKITVQIIEDRFSDEILKRSDIYELTLQLEIKMSEIAFLQQEKESLKQELDSVNKKCKYAQQKHQEVFKDLTTSKSMESKYKREIAMLKEQLSSEDEEQSTSARHDVSKSKSQSNLQNNTPALAPHISRNSSDRFIRTKSLKDVVGQ